MVVVVAAADYLQLPAVACDELQLPAIRAGASGRRIGRAADCEPSFISLTYRIPAAEGKKIMYI